MPENVIKFPRSASPVTRAGAGDISEREYSRERHNLHTTPPPRIQRAHPKKQLFLTPVNKFTAKTPGPSPNLARIRSCLDQLRVRERLPKIAHKAASMEDLTPTKRSKIEKKGEVSVMKVVPLRGVREQQAAARVGRFLLVAAWRRRREEVRCLRKTLEFQVTCSERLRMQVSTLKSLLDSDNAKVRLAMKELERLKQLLRDKDLEKGILEKEKRALEDDVCAAEDRVSEISIACHNLRNELELSRSACAHSQRALAVERAAVADARASADRAHTHLVVVEEELEQQLELMSAAQRDLTALRSREVALQQDLQIEREARASCTRECSELSVRLREQRAWGEALRETELTLRAQLQDVSEQLDWWPRPLTKMLGVAREWFRRPMSLSEALFWSLVPARHGC